MSVCLGQVLVLNCVTTHLEATCVLAILAMNLLQTTVHAMVSAILLFHACCVICTDRHVIHEYYIQKSAVKWTR